MLIVATTENAKRPFCLLDMRVGAYVRRDNGNILAFKTRVEAQQAADDGNKYPGHGRFRVVESAS